jgi:cobalt-zinc-cadmium efflux system protein
VIAQTGWTRIDALLSLAIVLLLVIAAWRLLRGAVAVLMDAVPPGIDLTAVESALRELHEIRAVHDVHCWAIHGAVIAFAAHIEVRPGHDPQHAIAHATQVLHDQFGIDHVTLQPELPTLYQPERVAARPRA